MMFRAIIPIMCAMALGCSSSSLDGRADAITDAPIDDGHLSDPMPGENAPCVDPSDWESTIIFTGDMMVNNVALDVDHDGAAHIVFTDRTGMRYFTNAGGEWEGELVDSIGSHGFAIAVGVDSTIHVVSGGIGAGVMYLRRDPGGWSRETIDVPGWGQAGADVAVDREGSVHVGYVHSPDYDTHQIRYATDSSGDWTFQTVDQTQYEWYWPGTAIAVDRDGVVHMAYQQCMDGSTTACFEGRLRCASLESGSWVVSHEDEKAEGMPALAADQAGVIHLVYSRREAEWDSEDELLYLTLDSGGWSTRIIDTDADEFDIDVWLTGVAGHFPSLALDPLGEFHLTYDKEYYESYLYATSQGESIERMPLESDDHYVAIPAVAVADGDVHIVYLGVGEGGPDRTHQVVHMLGKGCAARY